MSRAYRSLPAAIEKPALQAIMNRGLTRPAVTTAYAKWKQHAPAAPCRFGREQAVAFDCECPGCHERLMFLFFDEAAKRFAMLPPQ